VLTRFSLSALNEVANFASHLRPPQIDVVADPLKVLFDHPYELLGALLGLRTKLGGRPER
jgi:hypothetical protein